MTGYFTNLMILLNDFIGAALGFSEKSLRVWGFPSIPSGVQLPAPYGNGSSVHGLLITNQTCVFLSVSVSPPCDQHAAGATHNFILFSVFFVFFVFLCFCFFVFVRTISFGEAYLAQLDRMGTTWWWLDDNPYWTARMLYEHSAKLRGDKHGIAFSRWGEYFF